MARPKKGMHKADIKAAIAKKGYTLTGLSRQWNYSRNAISMALAKPWPEIEERIGKLLGLPPSDIWPDRYQANGLPKSGKAQVQDSSYQLSRNNQLSQAA